MCSSPRGISTTRIQIPISGNKLTLSLIQNHQLLAALLPQQQPKPLFPEKTIPPPQLEPLTQPSTVPPWPHLPCAHIQLPDPFSAQP
jgi:hypothetical protein